MAQAHKDKLNEKKEKFLVKGKHFALTLNNFDDYQDNIDKLLDFNFRYLIFSFEHIDIEGKTPHIQGYVQTHIRMRITTLKKLIGDSWHIGECNKGECYNAIYCIKEHGDYYEFGESLMQGQRTDLELIKHRILSGTSMEEIADKHFSKWVIYRRSFNKYMYMKQTPKVVEVYNIDVHVEILLEHLGTNDVHICGTFNPKLYRGESIIVILDELINDCDLYAYKLSGKNSYFYPAKEIYIQTSAFNKFKYLNVSDIINNF